MTTLEGRAGALLRRWEAVYAALCTPDSEDFDTGPQLAPGEQVVLATRYGWSAIDVYVNGQGDAGITNAVVKIYGIAGSVRALLSSTTIVSGGTTQRVAWRCAGCDKYEVSITPSAKPAVPTLISAKAFGREASDFTSTTTVTLAGDVVGPSNANTVVDLTGSAGVLTTSPGLVIKPSAAGTMTIGDLINTTNLTLAASGTIFFSNNNVFAQFTTAGLLPGTDNTTTLGSNALRWSLVRGVSVVSGDLELLDEERHAHWTMREHGDWVEARNRTTGDRFALLMRPLDPCEERESDYAEDKMVAMVRAREARIREAARMRKDEEEAARLEELADTLPPPDQQGAAE